MKTRELRPGIRLWGARFLLIVLIAGVMLCGGCSTWGTYPPIEGTIELSKPMFEPMPTLMASAIRYSRDRFGAREMELVINLPENTSPTVYDQIIDRLGEGRPMVAADEGAYHIKRVRLRGMKAEVDVIQPRRDGLHELVTVYFKNKFHAGWVVKHARLWRMRVEAPTPNFYRPERNSRTVVEETESVEP